jgi:hypothetical protein
LLLQLRLYIAFAVVAFFVIIAVIKFEATVVVKKLDLDFRRFSNLNPVCCCQQNFNWGLTNSSLLYLIVIILSSASIHLYSNSIVANFYFLPLDFKQLFLRFADFDVGQVLINFKSLANIFHRLQVFHFHRKLGKDIAMDWYRKFVSSSL